MRNYQGRKYKRGAMRPGDRGDIYHSSCPEPGTVRIVEVAGPAYADPTQFDRKSRYYDSGSDRAAPRWLNVDVRFAGRTRLVGLAELRGEKKLRSMQVLQRGNRLSITPVTETEWACIMRLVATK